MAPVQVTACGERFHLAGFAQVAFGTAGDCFTVAASLLAVSSGSQHEQAGACGPVSTPRGPDTIMMLPIASAE